MPCSVNALAAVDRYVDCRACTERPIEREGSSFPLSDAHNSYHREMVLRRIKGEVPRYALFIGLVDTSPSRLWSDVI